jgi:hypothetical protein
MRVAKQVRRRHRTLVSCLRDAHGVREVDLDIAGLVVEG